MPLHNSPAAYAEVHKTAAGPLYPSGQEPMFWLILQSADNSLTLQYDFVVDENTYNNYSCSFVLYYHDRPIRPQPTYDQLIKVDGSNLT